jgi:hypothetical protein
MVYKLISPREPRGEAPTLAKSLAKTLGIEEKEEEKGST